MFTQHKQKISVVDCGNDLLVAMDAAKVADVLVFVLAVHEGTEASVNVAGAKIISAIRAQGVPTTIGVIQGLDRHPPKLQNDLKKFSTSFFQAEFGESVKVTQANVNSQLSRAVLSVTPKTIHWRDARSYIHANAAVITPHANNDGKGELRVSGYIRGKPLSVNQLIHITDVGTFQMSHITRGDVQQVPFDQAEEAEKNAAAFGVAQDEAVLATADPELQEDLRFEAEYDPFAAEQTWPTAEELAEAEESAKADKKAANNKGMSSYQAAWVGDGDDDELNGDDDAMEEEDAEDDGEIDQAFCQTTKSVDGADDDDDDDDDMEMDDEDNDALRAQRYEEMQAKRKQEAENMTFPDEVDVPADTSARVRFARYRGLKSVRTSTWDPKESLPQDYARLFQFEDFAMVQRLALERGKQAERAMKAELRRKTQASRSRAASMASSMEVEGDQASAGSLALPEEFGSVGYVPSGVYVTLHIKDVPLQAFQQRLLAGPLIMGALLKHENRLSVLNFSIQRSSMFEDPLKSKDEVVFHCGFRRYAGKPVYSDQSLKSDQHLFQRFLPQSGWAVATVYAPVTFQPASVLMFRGRGHGNLQSDELVASGTLMNVNPDRVVLKRIILTATPVKVKKRKAVLRYMFRSPEDVRWFKPVELSSKHGLTGHIKESLGTHGDFKAVFNKPIKQHDTVCLHLYKRVYPKFAD